VYAGGRCTYILCRQGHCASHPGTNCRPERRCRVAACHNGRGGMNVRTCLVCDTAGRTVPARLRLRFVGTMSQKRVKMTPFPCIFVAYVVIYICVTRARHGAYCMGVECRYHRVLVCVGQYYVTVTTANNIFCRGIASASACCCLWRMHTSCCQLHRPPHGHCKPRHSF